MDRNNALGSSRIGAPISTSFSAQIGQSANLLSGVSTVKRPLSEIINMPAGRLKSLRQSNSDRNNNTRQPSAPSSQLAPVAPKPVKVVKECICNRPKCRVVCGKCDFTCLGRVRTPCYVHHRLTYLLEMVACPNCHSHDLQEERLTNPGAN